jgi:hypothetical protein
MDENLQLCCGGETDNSRASLKQVLYLIHTTELFQKSSESRGVTMDPMVVSLLGLTRSNLPMSVHNIQYNRDTIQGVPGRMCQTSGGCFLW